VGGALKHLSPIDLGVEAARGAIRQAGLEGRTELIDAAVFGNAMHTSIDSHYGARHVALRAGLSPASRGLTVNRICWSGAEAITIAAKELILGEADVVLAGGYESTSQSPLVIYGSSHGHAYMAGPRTYFLFKDGLHDTYADVDMMGTAENLARMYGITREETDAFALESQEKAERARKSGALAREITPVTLRSGKREAVIAEDEHPRADTTLAVLARLQAVKPGGVHTGGNASGIVDGAGAVIMTTAERARELEVEPIGELVSWAVAGVEPAYMGIGPVPAIRMALERAGLPLERMQNIEINEAFGAQYLAVERELGLDRSRVNVSGGAIALGHPLGATGARLVTSLLKLGGLGLASACIGGGQGGALILESYVKRETR
jgi:acetyl-CoA acetyltransferase family protein